MELPYFAYFDLKEEPFTSVPSPRYLEYDIRIHKRRQRIWRMKSGAEELGVEHRG